MADHGMLDIVNQLREDGRREFAAARAEQLVLLPAPSGDQVPAPAAGAPVPAEPTGGRPKGARNKVNAQLRELILQTSRDPLLVLAHDYVSVPPEALAQRLECKLLEAATLQVRAAETLAAYLHSKMPTAVAVAGLTPDLIMQIFQGAPGEGEGETADFLTITENG